MVIIVLLVLGLMPFATADDLWGQICGTSGNYTAKSTYQANLELLRTILPKNTSSAPTLFAKGSVGAAPDRVYGLALCRGDDNAAACGYCVSAAFQVAQQRCAYNKDATIYGDLCLLRFSNLDFLKANSSGAILLYWYDSQNITEAMWPGNITIITDIIKGLVQNTSKLAAYNSTRMYATGRMDVSSTFPPLYSMAQCTPDLQPGDCWDCLQKLSQEKRRTDYCSTRANPCCRPPQTQQHKTLSRNARVSKTTDTSFLSLKHKSMQVLKNQSTCQSN